MHSSRKLAAERVAKPKSIFKSRAFYQVSIEGLDEFINKTNIEECSRVDFICAVVTPFQAKHELCVAGGSAEMSGMFRAGDEIMAVDGQYYLSPPSPGLVPDCVESFLTNACILM